VLGNGNEEDYTQYSLSVTHTQQNHYTLSENEIAEDRIDMGSYRYFKFSLLESINVNNVSFMMNTLHGDADLYVSRQNKFPSKHDFEKSSVRVIGLRDDIFID